MGARGVAPCASVEALALATAPPPPCARLRATRCRAPGDPTNRHPARSQADTGGGGGARNAEELSQFVEDLLQQMQGKFETMSESVVGRIDEMNSRIDELERSLDELVTQAATAGKDSTEARAADGAGKGK